MTTRKHRNWMILVALFAALTMIFTLAGVSFAGGDNGSDETVCVSGTVINHREQPVDGTEFTPQLKVYAVGVPSTYSSDQLPDMAAEISTADQLDTLSSGGDSAEAAGIVIESADVDEDGYWEFEELPAGYYYAFALPLPAGWDGLVPEVDRGAIAWTGWAVLDEQDNEDDCYTVLFKIRRLFDVTVIKWEELQDGTVQPGNDWDITAFPMGDPFAVKQEETTDESGTAVLTLTPGTWLVQETVKDDWIPVTPSMVWLTLDQYAPPGATDPIVFKNHEPVCYASITVEKNGLGTDAKGGTVWLGPLAGWKITLDRPDGLMDPVTLVTLGSGKVTFEDLDPGVYTVEEKVAPGWDVISDNPQTVVIRDCEDARVLFENKEITGDLSISGHKFFQAWEPPYEGETVGISGWTITATLKGTDPELYVTTQTDTLGEYEFTQAMLEQAGMAISGATITVCEEERDHWIPVGKTCVDVTFPYPTPADYEGATVDFVNMQDPPPGAAAPRTYVVGPHYTVRRGDTVSSIAARYDTSVSELVRLNALSSPAAIYIGLRLALPK
ncbi:MAG: SpaA isopeptide-forming pilin-related protein [Caldilineales bacterium]